MMRKRKRKLKARQVPRRAAIFCQEARLAINSSSSARQCVRIGFSFGLGFLRLGHGGKIYLSAAWRQDCA